MNDTPSADPPPVVMARAARPAEVLASLSKLPPRHAIPSRPEDSVPYECDGLTAYHTVPLVVVLRETEAQVAGGAGGGAGQQLITLYFAALLRCRIMGEVMSSTLRAVSKNCRGSRRHAGILEG
jgi:hypothetical protein